MGKRRKRARGHGEEEQRGPGIGGITEVSQRKCSGSRRRRQGGDIWILLLRFLELLVICRSSFSGKQTSQAANGPNGERRGY